MARPALPFPPSLVASLELPTSQAQQILPALPFPPSLVASLELPPAERSDGPAQRSDGPPSAAKAKAAM